MQTQQTTIKCEPLSGERIKAIVLMELVRRKRLSRDATIASEYPIFGLKVRADLAIYDRSLTGIEIKSAADTIRRLDRQLSAYRMLFDRTILVLARRHLNSADLTKYEWLEIWEVDDSGSIHLFQRPKAAKEKKRLSYVQFMTRCESKRYALSKTTNCRDHFLSAFAQKFKSTSKDFWASVEDEIHLGNIARLSRYKITRETASSAAAAKLLGWEKWLLLMSHLSQHSVDQSLQASSVLYNPGSPP